MLTRKQKRYFKITFLVFISILFIYRYAYEKGYVAGGAHTGVATSSKFKFSPKAELNTSRNPEQFYKVVHIVDGDTIDIEKDGKKIRIRLLGINSPESVDPRRTVECYGKEAKNFMLELVRDKKVEIVLDSSKPEKDEYQRVLAYVFTEEGVFVNRQMIERGYAYEYTYKSEKYKYQDDFKLAQKQAREGGFGLWAQDTCSGKK